MTVKTRVLAIFLTLVFILIVLFSTVFAYFESVNLKREYEQLSRQTANGLAFMPALSTAITTRDNTEVQAIIDRVRLQANNPLVTVINREGFNVLTEEVVPSSQSLQSTLLFGSYITEHISFQKVEGIQTIAPVYSQTNDAEELVGAVVVQYPQTAINETLEERIWRNVGVGLFGLALSAVGAMIVSKSIQRDTFGYEPAVVASLYQERETLLKAVKEGIVAVDEEGELTLLNPAAEGILAKQELDQTAIQQLGLIEALKTGHSLWDEVRKVNGKVLVVNCRPIGEKGAVTGAIASFRDYSDMRQVKETLEQLQRQSDSLRAQTHEFKNKLYVLMGLLQLGKGEEALAFIIDETNIQHAQTSPLFEKIEDTGVQALILGKMAAAAEKHVHLAVEETSRLFPIPDIPVSDLSIILGNVLDNAIEAAAVAKEKKVLFFASDAGEEFVFDIYDSGFGAKDLVGVDWFEEGISTKGEGRGYGLSNVQKTLRKWNGFIEIKDTGDGTVVSVYIPKWQGGK
ncbi:GHKL domain-containing protein [Shouchella clausii]|uniref:sensor histidine kinase n=1 Tax=Shouchella clausii TaxID=79880 RepID=UPI002E1BE574|nr:GHKL domain-containing protein [Shouchella clausii]MED4177862.1 GHKL domain-containing protein [Shouchella clausii]